MQKDGEDPLALRNRPVLDLRQAYYYDAYLLCARGRQVTQGGVLPIPVSEIRDYCDLYQIHNLSERDCLVRYVTMIDDAYLKFMAERQKKQAQ